MLLIYSIFALMGRRRNKNKVFSNLEVIDAGAKGKTIAKAPDGKVVFLPNAVPGDIVDVQTFKQRSGLLRGQSNRFS